MTEPNKNALVPAAPTGLALAPSTDLGNFDYGDNVGKQPVVDKADYLKPVLTLLNGQSPYLVDPEVKVHGAAAGMLYDPSTGNLYDGEKGIALVLTYFIHSFDEWFPRKKRDDGTTGTPMADGRKKGRSLKPHDPIVVAAVAEARRLAKDPANKRKWYERRFPDTNNDMIETVCLYGLVVRNQDPLIFDPVVFPLSSTKLASWSEYYGRLVRFKNPVTGKEQPFCSHVAKVIVVADKAKDDQGQEFNFYTTAFKPYNGDYANSLLHPAHPLFAESVKFSNEVVDNKLWRLDEMDMDSVVEQPAGGAHFRAGAPAPGEAPQMSEEDVGGALF